MIDTARTHSMKETALPGRMDAGHNNGDTDHDWTTVSRKHRQPRTSPTIFIANIPEQMQVYSLKGIFQRFGSVVHASIPNRRTKRFNSRFGFIRYERPASAEEAIRKLNRAWYGDYHLIVKPARFERPPYPEHFQADQKMRSNFHEARYSNTLNLPSVHNLNKPSYADIVKSNALASDQANKVHASEPSIKVHATEADIEWLHRSVVVKASLPTADQSILSSLSPEEAKNIQVRAMGGKSYVLTFDSQEAMRNRIHKNKDWFTSRFEDAQEWSLWKLSNLSSRTVWINCYGVPLNLWNLNTFKSIGRVWGEVIMVDDSTLKQLSFECGRVLIITNQLEVINHAITLVCKHDDHIIRVTEEQTMSTHTPKAAGEFFGKEDDDVSIPDL
ncbi:uncharacterized protein LOC114321098 [Camellia sinensis]|uniref:uncharacterized protein LOC114321098 n=1 Tax=Camellia sinensis TaxID=4442 RepID=UPI001035825C|nr:uncharacterized protein LOC114321098 [Camellia sinensis]